MKELEKITEQLEEEGTIYLTDPDARFMWTHNGGSRGKKSYYSSGRCNKFNIG